MKIKFLQENLKNALNILQKAIPQKPQLPILGSILFEVKKDRADLFATDLFLGIKTSVLCQSDQDGKFVIAGEVFKQLIFSLGQGELSLDVSKNQVSIETLKTKVKIPIMDYRDYPSFPVITGSKNVISLVELDEITERLSKTASLDPTKPVLTAILLDSFNDKTNIVSTDGYRLSMLTLDRVISQEKILLPSRFVTEVARIASQNKSKELNMIYSAKEKQVEFLIDNTKIQLRVIEGEYPPYRKIIPDDFRIEFEFQAGELLDQLKRAQVFIKNNGNIVKIALDKKILRVRTASNLIGDYDGEIDIFNSNVQDQITIAFNATYLLDFLTSLSQETIWVGVNDTIKPVVFRVKGKDNFIQVIMPFKTSD